MHGAIYMIEYFDENGLSLGEKPILIVSNDGRNAQLDNYLAVRITTSQPIPGVRAQVPRERGPAVGRARCDDILIVYLDELKRHLGNISILDLQNVDEGLRAALAL